jgi:hypothetical protein
VDCPEFKDVPEMRLHQPMNTSAEASQVTTSPPQVKPLNKICASHPHRKRSSITSKSIIGTKKLRKKKQQQRKRSYLETTRRLRGSDKNKKPS